LFFAEGQPDLVLVGKEIPGQARMRVGVEANGDELTRGARGSGCTDLGRTGVAGEGAERAVERHGGKRQADHADDE